MFKVGDKVRRILRDNGIHGVGWIIRLPVGTEAKVVEVGTDYFRDGWCILEGYERVGFNDPVFLELVQEAPTSRSTDPVTSKGKRKVNKYEQAVLDYLLFSKSGATGKEIASGTGHPLNCITPRFAPLRRKGLITAATVGFTGQVTVLKRDKQIVWVLA